MKMVRLPQCNKVYQSYFYRCFVVSNALDINLILAVQNDLAILFKTFKCAVTASGMFYWMF